jgi:hypothetical protein
MALFAAGDARPETRSTGAPETRSTAPGIEPKQLLLA